MNLRIITKTGLLALLPIALAATAAAQATWYLSRDLTGNDNYNLFAAWNTAADGTGTAAGAMDAAAVYDTNGKSLRSTNVARSEFLGGTLLLNHSEFTLKAVATDIKNLATAVTGADIINGYSGIGSPQIGDLALRIANTFAVNGSTGLFSSTGRTITLEVGTLTGAGSLLVGGARQINTGNLVSTVTIKAADASAYTGDIIVSSAGTTLSFTGDFGSGGSLKLNTGVRLNLSGNLSFAGGIFIDNQAMTLTDGAYDYAALIAANAAFAGVVTDQGGSIIIGAIPEPAATAALTGTSILALAALARRRARG